MKILFFFLCCQSKSSHVGMIGNFSFCVKLTPAQSAQLGTLAIWLAMGLLGANLAALELNWKFLWVGSWGLMKGLKLGSTGVSASKGLMKGLTPAQSAQL